MVGQFILSQHQKYRTMNMLKRKESFKVILKIQSKYVLNVHFKTFQQS